MITDKSIDTDTNSSYLLLPEDKFDDIESDDEDLDLNTDKVKIQDRKLFVHTYDHSVKSLKEQIDDGALLLADDFQRRRVWDDTKASRLIESLLINVPIPVCYLAELEEGVSSVIDGQQRLTAIYRYLTDDLKLRSLKIRSDLNKSKFSQLGVTDRRNFNVRFIRCVLILKESDPKIRLHVFDRLNSNSVRLNRQELRNSLYRGSLNSLVKDLSKNDTFKKLRRAKDVEKRMNDCEMILRFFAFYFNGNNYQGRLSEFLDDYLQSGMKFSSQVLEEHQKFFLRTIEVVDTIFGENAFRRYDVVNNIWKTSINRAIYDIMMLYFTKLSSEDAERYKDAIINEFKDLFDNPVFEDSIATQPEKVTQMQTRLDLWRDRLDKIGIPLDRITIGTPIDEAP
jgi:uncharacterized protein with ParB-like and HNH nuclease domain